MSLIKYTNRLSPWPELDVLALASRANRIFGDAMPADVGRGADWTPVVSVQEFDNEFVLAVELPGVDENSLEIAIENNVLTISGEKRTEREAESEGKHHVAERSFGAFRRAFRLPGAVRTEAVAAELDNGLLTLRLPKAEQARTRKIEVSRPS